MNRLILIFAVLACALALFADPPADPILISPADGATGIDPNNVTLVWQTPLTGGMPSYSYVLIWGYPGGTYTSYVYYVNYPDQELDLSAQPGVDLGYSVNWMWAVMVYGGGSQSNWGDTFNFTTMAEGALPSPQVTITASGIFIFLDWPDVPGANSYLVYGADDPYAANFTFLSNRAVSNVAYIAGTKKFFKVVASSETPN
ncbi:MAG: hypothetical protein K0B87_07530 [Candidatus Syntrophosphaera sp.]|nr:hypothetical protein [Candidatus Syntrophosphaera sp.]